MGRLFLIVWLAAFSFQAADLGAIVAPDDCILSTSENRGTDPCPDGCIRCVCCARISVPASPMLAVTSAGPAVTLKSVPPPSPFSSAHPRGILHVPKFL